MAVLLALASGVLFGGMTVMLQFALRCSPGAELAAAVTTGTGFLVALLFLAGFRPAAPSWRDFALFVLAGAMAPASSQLLFTYAVRDIGPSRTSVIVGAAPLFAVAIALLALSEPPHAALLAGAFLIVCGGVLLASERVRPDHVRPFGFVLAIASAAVIAGRDNLARWTFRGSPVDPIAAATIALATGSLLSLAWLLATRGPSALRPRAALPFVPVGALFGLSYMSLFEAYGRGRVTIVSPIVATESLWAVGLAALLLRHELVGRRLALGAVAVVAGGALIGAFR